MGAWSHEPFGNDTACDWAFELDGQQDFSLVEKALRQAIESDDEYLDADIASEAVAAAEVLAKSRRAGTQSDSYTEAVDTWLAALTAPPPAELFKLATKALDRVMSPQSELREMWEESDEFAQWEASMGALRSAVAN